MKKSIKLLLLSLFLIPLGVNAATVDVSLSCPEAANASATVSCTIKAGPSSGDLKGIQANFSLTGGTITGFKLAEGWKYYSNEEVLTGISLGKTGGAATSSVTIGTLSFKMPSSGNAVVTLTGVTGSDSSYNTLSGSNVSKTIRVKSSVNTLDSLSLTGATITFDKNTTTYNVTIDASSTTISATKTDSHAKVSGTGKKTLNYGKNTLKVVVTAENGNKKTYTINVTRPDNRSANNNLSSLKLSNGKISFNKNTTTYNVEVEGTVSSVKLEAALEDTKASFVKNYGPRTIKLNYGKNAALIKVKAENTKEKTYTLNITRKDDRSSNANLSNITLSSGTIDFNKDTVAYQIALGNEVESINISANAEDKKSKVELKENLTLKEGSNVTEIKVTAENGTTKTYKLTIIRASKNQSLDTNNYLAALTVNGYTLSFNRDVLSYNLTIKEEQQLEIIATPESTKALAVITGNENLKNGSKIIIKVTAEDASVKEYSINITKPVIEEKQDSNNMFYIAIGVFALGIVSLLGAVSYKNKKKKN